ncbi:Myeloid-derived growth factor [Plecturocebus cupreus]
MAAPSGGRNGVGTRLWAALLLGAVALRLAEAVSEPTTVPFDVRPGGVVHSFSQNVGPGDKYTCMFTYASQGGTNEQWQMSLGTSEDHQHFTCTIWSSIEAPVSSLLETWADAPSPFLVNSCTSCTLGSLYWPLIAQPPPPPQYLDSCQHLSSPVQPQGKSYLYFTQFKAEVRGAEIEYAMAYSKAAFERESDVPLKNEEFEVTKTSVAHRPGAFKAELSKLVIVAKASHTEL